MTNRVNKRGGLHVGQSGGRQLGPVLLRGPATEPPTAGLGLCSLSPAPPPGRGPHCSPEESRPWSPLPSGHVGGQTADWRHVGTVSGGRESRLGDGGCSRAELGVACGAAQVCGTRAPAAGRRTEHPRARARAANRVSPMGRHAESCSPAPSRAACRHHASKGPSWARGGTWPHQRWFSC